MLRVWRLVTARFADTAFSGEGARRYGGRWNPKGVPVVYTSGSLSLALLEMLVQDQPLRARYVAIPAEIPPGVEVERLDMDRLPADWRTPAALETLRAIGGDWASRLATAVLAVPSAVIPAETNYLLNREAPRLRPDPRRRGPGACHRPEANQAPEVGVSESEPQHHHRSPKSHRPLSSHP